MQQLTQWLFHNFIPTVNPNIHILSTKKVQTLQENSEDVIKQIDASINITLYNHQLTLFRIIVEINLPFLS